MINLLYNILSSVAALVILPAFILYSVITGKKSRGLGHHFGYLPKLPDKGNKKRLWIHTLSFGEVNAATPVLKILHEENPELDIVVSVTTDSGYDGAQSNLPFASAIIFHPLDCWPFLKLAVDKIQPDLFVLTDTGFWPGMIGTLHAHGVPQVLFNGRISEKSLKCYGFVKPWVAGLLNAFETICMQNDHGVDALRALGIDAQKLRAIGDTKYDGLKPLSQPEASQLREALRIPVSHPVWVAGSTHAGEEQIVLEAFQKVKAEHPDLTLILAPRRNERINDVISILKRRALEFTKRSEIQPNASHGHNVILLDTMGELGKLYAVADVAFVGRSLIAPGGGHSLIEPVAQGKPVLHGPYVDNVKQSAQELGAQGLAIEVSDAEDMANMVGQYISNESARGKVAEKAAHLLQVKKGASREMAEIIQTLLKNNS